MSNAIDRLRARSAIRELERDDLEIGSLGESVAYDNGYYDFYYNRGKRSDQGADYERGYADAAAIGQQRASSSDPP